MYEPVRAPFARITSAVAVVFSAALAIIGTTGCGDNYDDLVEQLTEVERFQPPESLSTDSAKFFPTLYIRSEGDSLVGVVNQNPTKSVEDATDSPPRMLVESLKFARETLDGKKSDNDTTSAPPDINIVADSSVRAWQILYSFYIASEGSFYRPHLVTAKGTVHTIVPPDIQNGLPWGWTSWIWWAPSDTISWSLPPDTSGMIRPLIVPPRNGKADIGALIAQIDAAYAQNPAFLTGGDRVAGITPHDRLPYTELVALMDSLRFRKNGPALANNVTLAPIWIWQQRAAMSPGQ